MLLKRYDLAIINRSFWPKNKIIGESLLQLSEKTFHDGRSAVKLRVLMVETNRCSVNPREFAIIRFPENACKHHNNHLQSTLE